VGDQEVGRVRPDVLTQQAPRVVRSSAELDELQVLVRLLTARLFREEGDEAAPEAALDEPIDRRHQLVVRGIRLRRAVAPLLVRQREVARVEVDRDDGGGTRETRIRPHGGPLSSGA